MTVYKYPCRVQEKAFRLEMPRGSHTVAVQMQHGMPHLWAIVTEHRREETRWFRWYGTGHEIDHAESPRYVGTVQMDPYVWHLFEVTPEWGVDGEPTTPVDFNDPRIT